MTRTVLVKRDDRRIFVLSIAFIWAMLGGLTIGGFGLFLGFVGGLFGGVFFWDAIHKSFPKKRMTYPKSMDETPEVRRANRYEYTLPEDTMVKPKPTPPEITQVRPRPVRFSKFDQALDEVTNTGVHPGNDLSVLDDERTHAAALLALQSSYGYSESEARRRLKGATGTTTARIQYAIFNTEN